MEDRSQPTIASISPHISPVSGKIDIKIRGTGFQDATGATIGGHPVTNFRIVDDATITGTTPPGIAGFTIVRVITPTGKSDIIPSDHFLYE